MKLPGIKGSTISARALGRGRRRDALPILKSAPREPPIRRGQCEQTIRPCPFVTCRHHLFLEVRGNGGIKLPFGENVDVLNDMPYTCSLDAAKLGGMTLEEVASALNLTRERVRQLETRAIRQLENEPNASFAMDSLVAQESA